MMIGRVLGMCCVCVLGACASRSTEAPARPPAHDAAVALVDAGTTPPPAQDAVPPSAASAEDAAAPPEPKDAGAPPRELSWRKAADCPVARFEAGSILYKGELWV